MGKKKKAKKKKKSTLRYNRRSEVRETTSNCASIEIRGGNDQAIGIVFDVSSGGLGLQTGQPPTSGDHVTVRVTAADHTDIHTIGAIVCHVRKIAVNNYIVGLRYDDPLRSDPFLEGVLGKTLQS